jgi:CRISPR-associated exonuclease Cas4
MESKQLILSVTAVAEYLYCPRSCFYKIFHAEENDGQNIFIVDGRNRHEVVHQESDSPGRKSNISVFSHKLGLSGKLDLLEIKDGQYIPIEYKRGRTRNSQSINVQLCLYALCLEEMYSVHISTGYIYFSEDNRRVPIDINVDLREKAMHAITEVHNRIQKNNIRDFIQVNNTLCEKCSYFQACMPFLEDSL